MWHDRAASPRTTLPRMRWRPQTQRPGPIQALLQPQMASSTKRQIIPPAHTSRLCWQIRPRAIPSSADFAALWLGKHGALMKPFILQSDARCVCLSRLCISALHTVDLCAQVALPACGTCGLATPRPFVCLDCAYFGCWNDDHIVEHLNEENHRFCASIYTYDLPCFF